MTKTASFYLHELLEEQHKNEILKKEIEKLKKWADHKDSCAKKYGMKFCDCGFKNFKKKYEL